MRRLDLSITDELDRRVRRLQSEQGLSVAAASRLGERARAIIESRIRPDVTPFDPSIGPENCCQGIRPIIEATVSQACLDAARFPASRLASERRTAS